MSQDLVVKDPVCGMEKPASQMKASSVYKDKTYYFCSQMDKDMFDAHPDHWVKLFVNSGFLNNAKS